MPCVMYGDMDYAASILTHLGLKKLLEEVKSATGRKWVISEREIYTDRFFRKPTSKTFHTLLLELSTGEWQVMNFDIGTDRSINQEVEACHIVNYLNGILGGCGMRNQEAK